MTPLVILSPLARLSPLEIRVIVISFPIFLSLALDPFRIVPFSFSISLSVDGSLLLTLFRILVGHDKEVLQKFHDNPLT